MTLNVPTLDEYGRAVYQNKTLNVKIPKGIAEGQQIRLAGQGLPGYNGGENGDLILKNQVPMTNLIYTSKTGKTYIKQ